MKLTPDWKIVERLAVSLTVVGTLAASSVCALPSKSTADSSVGKGESKSTKYGSSQSVSRSKSSDASGKSESEAVTADKSNTDKLNTDKPSSDATADNGTSDQSRIDAEDSTVTVEQTAGGIKITHTNKSAALTNEAADHYDLAQHYIHKWDWEMSELELETAIMCVPNLKAAHRDYCVVSLMRGQPMRSLAEMMMVVGLGEAIPLNDAEKKELKEKAAKMHYQKGLGYGVVRKWKKATPEFQWALSYAPNSAAITHSLAFSYAAAGDFEQAERLYVQASALDPNNSYTHADFAILLSDHGDKHKAMEELAKAIQLSPDIAALHVDMAWLAESAGDLQTAESEFNRAVQLSPKHAGLWSHLGRVEERLGKAGNAKNAYNEALAVDPQDDEAKARLAALSKPAAVAPKPASGANDSSGPATETKKQS
jgi:Flp pilus assembly protein TadD